MSFNEPCSGVKTLTRTREEDLGKSPGKGGMNPSVVGKGPLGKETFHVK